MKCTPFYYSEVKHEAKMTSEGWIIPTEFAGEIQEHTAIRERVGINDFSAMGEIDVKGKNARKFLDEHCVNDAANLQPGRIVYTTFLNENAEIIDDTTIYCHNDRHFWVITSAPRRADMVKWLEEESQKYDDVCVTEISSAIGLLSVQGPMSKKMLEPIVEADLDIIPYFGFTRSNVSGIPALISRTGFTGELGFEILVNSEDGNNLWNVLDEAGKPYGSMFCGIKAGVNSIPLEKGYLTIREYNDNNNPLEIGLGWSVRWEKPYFVGQEKLKEIKEKGATRKLMGFVAEDDTVKIPLGSQVLINDKVIGKVTSANYGHTIQKSVGLCFVPSEYAKAGQKIVIKTDQILLEATLENKTFYDPKGLRAKG
jgi:aminomethyltransferase